VCDWEINTPLAFSKLKTETIEHELMFISEDALITGFLRSEPLELFQAI
jgi:hypothetical protein